MAASSVCTTNDQSQHIIQKMPDLNKDDSSKRIVDDHEELEKVYQKLKQVTPEYRVIRGCMMGKRMDMCSRR
jgi:hypothetical protein